MFKGRIAAKSIGGLVLALVMAVWSSAAPAQSFVDPTARIIGDVRLGELVYVAPFAILKAGGHRIDIGNESDVQDNVTLEAKEADIVIGEQVILAHGASVIGRPVRLGAVIVSTSLGEEGACPGDPPAPVCPSFVGFNAMVDGAVIEKDAMVQTLARVAPGVTIPSGRKVLPGKNVASDAEVTAKTAEVTEADREFMHGVIEVNTAFAEQYAVLAAEDPSNVRGINVDPGNTAFNPLRNLPTLNGVPTRDPGFRNRIIGDVRTADGRAELDAVMGEKIALRADEGEPFAVGSIDAMGSRAIFHALEHTHLQLGNHGRYGERSLVHGGPTPFDDATVTGDNVQFGERAVFFRSRVGDNSRVGARSLVQQSDLPAGTVIPDRTVVINNEVFGSVEW